MTEILELQVDVVKSDKPSQNHKATAGVIVFESGEFNGLRNVAQLRKKIVKELAGRVDSKFLFLKDSSVLTPTQESSRKATTVVKPISKGASSRGQFAVSIKAAPATGMAKSMPARKQGKSHSKRENTSIVSFDGRGGVSSHAGYHTPSSPTSANGIRESGFLQRLEIFSGVFARYFFQLDNSGILYVFGPYSDSQAEPRSVSRSDATETVRLHDVYAVRPYDGALPAPQRHFCMEVCCDGGNKLVLAAPTIAEFAKWIKMFHKFGPNLPLLQYNIVHEKYKWSTEPKRKRAADSYDSSRSLTTTKIKTFKVVTFQDLHFGMQLTSSPDGTIVHSVLKNGLADSKGVSVGDFLVAVNDKSVVGMGWRSVKQEILSASCPVRITFGKQKNVKPATARPTSVSSPSAFAGKLGPYFYSMQQKVLQVGRGARLPLSQLASSEESNGLSGQDTSVKVEPITTAFLVPMRQMLTKYARPLFGGALQQSGVVDLDSDTRIVSSAASRQLTRYRGLQRNLYEAIQDSYQREEQVELLVKNLVSEARRDLDMSNPPALQTRAKRGMKNGAQLREQKMIEDFQSSIVRKDGTSRAQSVRTDVAVSSRLSVQRVTTSHLPLIERLKNVTYEDIQAAPSMCPCGTVFNRREAEIATQVEIVRHGSIQEQEAALESIFDMCASLTRLDLLMKAGLLPLLISALRSKDSILLRENAAGIMWNLSDDPTVAQAVIKAKAVPLLVDLLRYEADDKNSSDIAKEEAAGALWYLADYDSCKSGILKKDGIQVMINALMADDTTDFTKENLAGALWNLSFDPSCVDAIMRSPKSHDPIAALSKLIVKGTVVAQENAAGALMRISLARPYRENLKNCSGAIPALVQLLAFGSGLSRENACGALHNIATDDQQTQRLVVEEGAVPPLVRLLQDEFPVTTRTRAALCLRTLAQNPDNKQEISQAGSVEQLVRALQEEDVMLQIHIVEALWGLAHENEANKVFIGQSGAIPKLVSILKSGNETAKVRAAGTLGTLAENKTNSTAIVRSGALDTLVSMVSNGKRESQREAAHALSNLSIGSEYAQKTVLKKLKGGAKIGVNAEERNNIMSVQIKLNELGVIDDAEFYEVYQGEKAGLGKRSPRHRR